MLPVTSVPVPLNPEVPVAVRVHSFARLSPPSSLITVFFSVSTGALSSLVIVQSTIPPGTRSTVPSLSADVAPAALVIIQLNDAA